MFTEIIKNWFDENGDLIDYSNRSFYLILLFEELVENGLHNNDIISISKEILKILEKDFIDDSLFLLDQRRIAEEISYVYSICTRDTKTVKEIKLEQVQALEDGDVYINDTSEPDIDLRGVDLGEIYYDKEFMNKLIGTENE